MRLGQLPASLTRNHVDEPGGLGGDQRDGLKGARPVRHGDQPPQPRACLRYLAKLRLYDFLTSALLPNIPATPKTSH